MDNLLNVMPFGNTVCAAKVTGQQLLDFLEFSSAEYPEESGYFLHVSGLEYTIDTSVASTVTKTDTGEFTGVTGEYRVKNVLVGGEPLDLEKTYTAASIRYLLVEGVDGYVISGKSEIYKDDNAADIKVLVDYLKNDLGGVVPEKYSDPTGEGRITISEGTEEPVIPQEPEDPQTEDPQTEDPQTEPGNTGAQTSEPADSGNSGNTPSGGNSSGGTPSGGAADVPATGSQSAAAQAAFATVVLCGMAIAVFSGRKKH